MRTLALLATPASATLNSHHANSGANIAIWVALAVALSSSRRGRCRFRAPKKPDPTASQS
ncbi:MAG: hypothetical protein JST05_05740 [Acidobacteria bacterium]|nr:hypothetical protein [Acidobacteriota bacterium]